MAIIYSYPLTPTINVKDKFLITRNGYNHSNYSVLPGTISDFIKQDLLEDGTIDLRPNRNIEIDNIANGVALKSPDGTAYRVMVDDEGALITSPYAATFLGSSWGARFNVYGGSILDGFSSYDWAGGSKQIVSELTTVGHVITNFTNPAKGMYYTLRTNPRMDVASIHPAMVPSLENEQIIINAINTFKDAGKKVILYINAGGPSTLQSGNAEELAIQAAWQTYCDANFGGDLGAGWKELARGYSERFRDLGVDGYWIDNLNNLPGGDVEGFVDMIREVDPSVAISTNLNKSYIKREDNPAEDLIVTSDGIGQPANYRIFTLEANDPYMDFTAGHVTPLATGAPPNSWAYEEFTIPLVSQNVWSSYDNSKQVLKHGFFPVRSTWSSPNSNLVFELEQAYRFVRNFTDYGAAITWSTTITNGLITKSEMDIMRKINSRMAQSIKPEYEAYVRPEGASTATN